MIEVRRDFELPSIQDGDPAAVPKMAEALLGLVAGDIPGVGIDHTMPGASLAHWRVHDLHQGIIVDAAQTLGSQVSMGDSFRRVGSLREEPHLPLHYDRPRSLMDHEIENDHLGLPLFLRLHTADPKNGAEVMMANSMPGIDPAAAGDAPVFKLPNRTRQAAIDELGYDASLQHFGSRVNGEVAIGVYEGATGVDATRVSGDIYHYTQQPLSSVLFRSRAALGSVTLHGFRSLDPSLDRTFYISNVTAYSQAV